jgi:hypothetical protein
LREVSIRLLEAMMGPKLKLFVSLTCALFVGAAPARASTTYTYTGPNFNDIEGGGLGGFYTTSMNVTGTFTVAAPLISLSGQDITSSILSFSFFDGLRTIMSSNATSFGFTNFSTDALGNLTAWDISVHIGDLAATGDEEQDIGTLFIPQVLAVDQGDIALCVGPVVNGSCAPIAAEVGRAQFNNPSQIPGVWTETPLPAALPLFATGLGGLGLLGWRRKRKAPSSRQGAK